MAEKVTGWIDENGNDGKGRFTWKILGQGATTHLVAAFDSSIVGMLNEIPSRMIIWDPLNAYLAEHNGSYFQAGQVDNDAAKSYAKDKEVAAKLWALTEGLVGQKFDYSGVSSL